MTVDPNATRRKPVVYIASPYTRGDVAQNVWYQCQVFDQLLNDGRVLPVAPLWSHFQHTMLPRPYEDWIRYDQELLHLYDCCLRLKAINDKTGYEQWESSGADGEVASFKRMGKPVFTEIAELLAWVEER